MKKLKQLLIFMAVAMVIAVVVTLIANPTFVKNLINNVWREAAGMIGMDKFDLIQ